MFQGSDGLRKSKFVTTKTPAQIGNHAQKYFLRQTETNKMKRRLSVFNLTLQNEAEIKDCLVSQTKKSDAEKSLEVCPSVL